jgi:DNA-binding response OmpR family regulator
MIALDVEDLIQNHFDYSVAAFTLSEAAENLEIIDPELMIVDCDINDPNISSVLEKIDNLGIRKICFCTSNEQAINLKSDLTDVLLKPFDNDELKALISGIDVSHNKLAAEEIASGP